MKRARLAYNGKRRNTPQGEIVFGAAHTIVKRRFAARKGTFPFFAFPRGAQIGFLALSLIAVGLVYAFSNPAPAGYFDYQTRTADAFLSGHLGIAAPPSWLNEMTPDPRGGFWYSVFPLGSVLSFLPVALLKRALPSGAFTNESVRWIVALLSTGIAFFLFRLSSCGGRNDAPLPRRLTLTAFVLFGSWLWPNLAYGAAWHLSLGLAVLGETAALYFVLSDRPRPLFAGFCFALAFGNRTEILLSAPLFLYLLWRPHAASKGTWRIFLLAGGAFLAFPFVLGVATLMYNYARYGSVTDFGYTRIPGVLNEMWYRDGLHSWIAFPMNCHAMLLEAAWRIQIAPPFLIPNPLGGSIFASSPYLFLLFQGGGKNRGVVVASWLAIALMTLLLWSHGNSGGWQFSYRYGLVLLPWAFLILTEISPPRVRLTEIPLLALSIALNAFATYQFFWTNNVHV